MAFIRENVQNAVDAIRIQALRDDIEPSGPSYMIDVHIKDRTLTVRDNGIGMTASDLQNFFWTIGASGKRTGEAQKAGCVGMFGIGGFANFGVCDKVEVISQTEGASSGTYTSLSQDDIKASGVAIPSVTVRSSSDAAPRGTIVIGHLRETPNVEALRRYLRDFVRFVPILVAFDGEKLSQSFRSDRERYSALRKFPVRPYLTGTGGQTHPSEPIASVSSCKIIGQRFDQMSCSTMPPVIAMTKTITRGDKVTRWVAQVPGTFWRDEILKGGESFPARRSGTFALKPPTACGASPAEVDIAIS